MNNMIPAGQLDSQKKDFEQAGFTDFDAKYEAWIYAHITNTRYPIYFSAPPVCTAYWDTQSWLRHVDWKMPANDLALRMAKERISRQAV